MPGRARQAARDYAGLAALITAVAGSAVLLLQQYRQGGESDKVQDSFIVLVEYRLGRLEAQCGLSRRVGMPVVLPRAEKVPTGLPKGAEAAIGDAEEAIAEAIAVEEAETPTAVRLRQYVQKSGRALTVEDLRGATDDF